VSAFAEVTDFEIDDEPFPYAVLYGALDPDVLRAAWHEFDAVSPVAWQRFRNGQEMKDAARFAAAPYGGAVNAVREVLESEPFIALVEGLFDIDDLTPDDLGGGMHSIPTGGMLASHVDFNLHDDGRYRRINCLVFLNDDPHPSGDLILEGPDRTVRIPPRLGTIALFATSETSWHGHPEPWQGETPRRSIAMYYYTAEPPPWAAPAHSTIFAGAAAG